MPSQQSISQKRPWLDTKNRSFSPFHQTTLSINLLTVGPPLLHWLGIGWWYSSHSMVVPPFSFCFLSFSCYFCRCCSTLSCSAPPLCLNLLCPCLSLLRIGMGLLGLPHFCPFLDLWACLLLVPARLACWAFSLSFLSLGPFETRFPFF